MTQHTMPNLVLWPNLSNLVHNWHRRCVTMTFLRNTTVATHSPNDCDDSAGRDDDTGQAGGRDRSRDALLSGGPAFRRHGFPEARPVAILSGRATLRLLPGGRVGERPPGAVRFVPRQGGRFGAGPIGQRRRVERRRDVR